MHEAALAAQTLVEDISFAGAIKTALTFSATMRYAPPQALPALRDQMLRHIASQTNHHPFDRVEPRLIKRDPVRFAYLRGTTLESTTEMIILGQLVTVPRFQAVQPPIGDLPFP